MNTDTDSLRILFVTPYLPSAIRVRPFQLIRHLVKSGHRVTVVALDDGSPADRAALRELNQTCEAVYLVPHSRLRAASQAALSLPTPTPLWAAWCHSPPMAELLRSLAASGRFDVAHIEHLRAAHFAPALGNLPCVFDAVDCITDLQRQIATQTPAADPRHWLAWEEMAKLRRYEPAIYRPFGKIAVTSQYDADALAALGVRTSIAVIPNGVNVETGPPSSETRTTAPEFDLIFTGKMSYGANEDACLYLLNEILPPLDAMRPDAPPASVCIAGSGPTRRLRRAAARRENRVTITGYVDDLRPFLARARIAVCPMRIGVGIQNKVLEAMAAGLPVVATPLAGRALNPSVSGSGLRIAADAAAFARHCAEWLEEPEAASRAGEAGQRYVRAFHRWDTVAAAFTGLYLRVLGEPKREQ